jgi:hypothetical protein
MSANHNFRLMTPAETRFDLILGARYRCTVEGELVALHGGHIAVLRVGNGEAFHVDADARYVTWERLPDVEPVWQVGDVVLTGDGGIVRHAGLDVWQAPGGGMSATTDLLIRPLTLLVRDGEPVRAVNP